MLFVKMMSLVFLSGFSTLSFAAKLEIRNSNNQDIWVAVAAWMVPQGNTDRSEKVHKGFFQLVPGEKRVFFDRDGFEINTAYAAIGYMENGAFVYKQPKEGSGPGERYFDLSIQDCTAIGNKYECDVDAQVLNGLLTSSRMRLHLTQESGIVSALRDGKTIRFVGYKTSTVIPNDIAR